MMVRKLLAWARDGSLGLLGLRVVWRVERERRRLPRGQALPVALHIGPGPGWSKPDGSWLTIDVDPKRGDLVLNLQRPVVLPLPSGSVYAIYASHVLEHINPQVARLLLAEFYRVLAPTGCLRIVVPDARRSLVAYMSGEEGFPLFGRRRATAQRQGLALTLFECMRGDFISVTESQVGLLGKGALAHQNAWDFPTLALDLERAGFPATCVRRSRFRESSVPAFSFEGSYPSEANEVDRSMYVEAWKPELP